MVRASASPASAVSARNAGFTDVDRTTDPDHFIAHLDRLTAFDWIQVYKRHTYDLLALQAGDRVVEIGCGTGEDVLAMAARVGATGRVVGIEHSEMMVRQAQERAAGAGLPAEYVVGDCFDLQFVDGAFDGCRADRIFHHLTDPARAMHELARIAAPGARVVVSEPDFGTIAVDAPDCAVTRHILDAFCDSVASGWVARHLAALMRDAGLTEIVVEPWHHFAFGHGLH